MSFHNINIKYHTLFIKGFLFSTKKYVDLAKRLIPCMWGLITSLGVRMSLRLSLGLFLDGFGVEHWQEQVLGLCGSKFYNKIRLEICCQQFSYEIPPFGLFRIHRYQIFMNRKTIWIFLTHQIRLSVVFQLEKKIPFRIENGKT